MKPHCTCDVCRKVTVKLNFHWPLEYGKDGFATKFWHHPKGPCGVCNDDRSHEHMSFVPIVMGEFLGTREICEVCRNQIQGHVTDWGLCWDKSPDEALKWAMNDWLLQNYKYHLSSAFGRDRGFKTKRCCEANHGRAVTERKAKSR